jgi:hypothetical protein
MDESNPSPGSRELRWDRTTIRVNFAGGAFYLARDG